MNETPNEHPSSTSIAKPALGLVALPKPANENLERGKRLRVMVNIPHARPVQWVEDEVIASLMDDLAALIANDNQEAPK